MKTTAPLSLALGLLLLPCPLRADMIITPEEGYSIVWDGNEGDNFAAENPAPVPPNLATAPGAAAIASGELGPELGIAYHFISNLNDGLYGNANSWIGGSSDAQPAFAGVALGRLATITSFAFGRDNGNNATDVNNGQLIDRCLGLYTVQITRVESPDAATEETGDPATGWATIGSIEYLSNNDAVIGGEFTAYYRHEFEVAQGTAALQATGFRLLVPVSGIAGGIAIDEIELYGPDVVNPDKDGDGFDDEVEVALGTNPDDRLSTPESRTDLVTAVEFKFHAAKNKFYRIEASTNFQDWATVEDDIRGTGSAEPLTRLFSITGQPVRHFRAVRKD